MKKRRAVLFGYRGRITLILLSISTSLAWYASARKVKIDTVNVTIESSRNLTISTKEEDGYKSHLAKEDLSPMGLFEPVSSASYGTLFDDDSQEPVFYQNYSGFVDPLNGIPFAPEGASSGYYQQTLYLKADDDVYVTLDPDKCSFLPDEEENRTRARERYPSLSKSEMDDLVSRRDSLVKALRVSLFVPHLTDEEKNRYDNIRSFTVIDPYKEKSTLFGGALDTGYDGYYDYFSYSGEDNSLYTKGEAYETIYGNIRNREKAVYSDIMDDDGRAQDKPNYDFSSFDSRHRQGVHCFDLEASRNNGRIVEEENSLSLDELGSLNSKRIIPLYRNKPRKIVLSIYLEGWDRDCINQTRGASFLSSVSFEIARER